MEEKNATKAPINRRQFLKLAGVAGSAALLAACAKKATEPVSVPTEATEPVTITYWHGWAVEHEKAAMEAAVDLFNKSHPNIKVEAVSGKTNDQVLTAISGGTPPDVWSLWSTATLAQWAASGFIMDLTDLVATTGLKEDTLYPAAPQISKYKGSWYGLPIEIDAAAVYYNKDIFKESGYDPEKPPQTLEELFAMAKKMTKLDDAGNIVQLGFSEYALAEHIAYMYGGSWWNSTSGQPTANLPANIEAWTVMKDWYATFGAEKVSTFNSQQADNPLGSLFIAGKVAIALDGDWVTNFPSRFNPNMKWGVFALPAPSSHPETAFSTPVDGSIYVIPNGAPHPEQAWEFVNWMGTSKEASCILQKGWANGSPVKEVSTDAQCMPNPEYQLFLDLMNKDKMLVWPPIAVSAFYADQRNAAADAVKYAQMTPEEALNDLQQKVEEELKKVTQ